MKRRDFIGKAGIGLVTGVAAASALSTPALAQTKKTITKHQKGNHDHNRCSFFICPKTSSDIQFTNAIFAEGRRTRSP